MMECASANSYKTKPMPDKTTGLQYSAIFSKSEFAIMRRGLVPRFLDDKWFIFCDNKTLFFHRSGTGHCIYRVELIVKGGKYHVSRALVNRDSMEYSQEDTAYDTRMLHFIIRCVLLKEHLLFPLAPGACEGSTQEALVVPSASVTPWWKFWVR